MVSRPVPPMPIGVQLPFRPNPVVPVLRQHVDDPADEFRAKAPRQFQEVVVAEHADVAGDAVAFAIVFPDFAERDRGELGVVAAGALVELAKIGMGCDLAGQAVNAFVRGSGAGRTVESDEVEGLSAVVKEEEVAKHAELGCQRRDQVVALDVFERLLETSDLAKLDHGLLLYVVEQGPDLLGRVAAY